MAGAGNLALVGIALVAPVGIAVGVALPFVASDAQALAILLIAGFLVFAVEMAAIGTAGQVLSLALYRNAVSGEVVGPFSADDLDRALVPRRRLRRKR